MIFAKLDVDITDHPKAIEAGPAAFGLWAWALAYCRKHELDGAIGIGAVRHALGGDPGNLALADKLVEVGLWANRDGGWTVLNYASKNETKAGIAERRAADRARKAPRVIPPPPPFREESKRAPLIEVVGIPGSDSGSDSDSGSVLGGSAEGNGRQTPPPKDIQITPELVDSCKMVGAPPPTRDHVQTMLARARLKKPPKLSENWPGEVVLWMLRQKGFDRERPSGSHIVQPAKDRCWETGETYVDPKETGT